MKALPMTTPTLPHWQKYTVVGPDRHCIPWLNVLICHFKSIISLLLDESSHYMDERKLGYRKEVSYKEMRHTWRTGI